MNLASLPAVHRDEAHPAGRSPPAATPRAFDIVVIGASAGGVVALRQLVSALPGDYGGAIFITQHTSPDGRSELAALLDRTGLLPVMTADDGLPVVAGHIHVAPSDRHLLLEKGFMHVVRGPRENRHRPAIDPMFRSAAWTYGSRVVGVVLSGNLVDGTAGLWAIKSCGGTTVVQEPEQASSPGMPTNALLHNRIDHRLAIGAIADLLLQRDRSRQRTMAGPTAVSGRIGVENAPSARQGAAEPMDKLGLLSPFICPSCGSALWELKDGGGHLRYRCHTGHSVTQAGLLLDQDIAVEDGLFRALRAVQEKVFALRRLAERWPAHLPTMRTAYLTRAEELENTAAMLRRLLAGGSR